MPFVYDVSKCFCGIFDIWSHMAPESILKVKKIGPGVPQGRPKSVPPQRFRKTGRENNAPGPQIITQMVPTWEPTSESLEYFWEFL